MADSKLSALPTGAAIADADLFYSDQAATSVKQPASAVATYLISKTGIGSAVTSGTAGSVLFIGSGSVLAQDNANFFWDDTGHVLKLAGELDFQSSTAMIKIGGTNKLDYGITTAGKWTASSDFVLDSSAHSYFIGSAEAIFIVPNVTRNNWFEGAAGNKVVTGYGNFGTGDSALQSVTSGFDNVAIGSIALKAITSGYQNIAVGSGSMQFSNSGDQNNIGIGFNTLATLGIGGAGLGGNANNLAIGFGALGNVSIAAGNVAIGTSTGANFIAPTTANFNTIIGNQAANNLGTGGGASITSNTFIGAQAGSNITTGSSNVWIGGYRGPSAGISNTVSISDGGGQDIFDFSVTTFQTWSIGYNTAGGGPPALHIYNFQDANGTAMTSYERAVLTWNLTTNVFRLGSQAGGTGTIRIIAIDAFSKAGAPAAGDLPSGTWALIDDTTNNQTWLVFNKAGTIRKVQLT